ncbi:MAG: pyruvate kinase [Verrucomicrobia bacterium]|nr:pyruvate kinase [Verrucomicrobiota bacterium]
MKTQKTKIVCTIGPATQSAAALRALVRAGMDVARLNFSHGTPAEHAEVLGRVRAASKWFGVPVAVLQDLSGPKVRLGEVGGGSCVLKARQTVVLTADEVVGDAQTLSVTYPHLAKEVRPRQPIFINDGAIRLSVVKTDGSRVTCRVIVGGTVSSRKGVNLPKTALSVGSLTDKDRADAVWGLEHGVDFFALSFVRTAGDVKALRAIIAKAGKQTPIIAKIEKREALRNLDEILDAADGVMVARGDLGVEIDLADIPAAQKRLIAACNRVGKPVITATQMLESMVTNTRPTRAEVTDVANAICDGTDAVMLSQETAIGAHAKEAVRMMASVAERTERRFAPIVDDPIFTGSDADAVADGVCHAVAVLARAARLDAIVACTTSGATARFIGRYRPRIPIYAVSPEAATVRELALSWGVQPIETVRYATVEAMVEKTIELLRSRRCIKAGDRIALLAGLPIDTAGVTNLLRIIDV